MIPTFLWFIEQPDGLWRISWTGPQPFSGEIGHKRTFYGPDPIADAPSGAMREIDVKRWMHSYCQRGYVFTQDGKVTMRKQQPDGKILVAR